MKKYRKQIIYGIILFIGIATIFLFFSFKWWFLAPLSLFKLWYPNSVYAIFILKLLLIFSFLFLVFNSFISIKKIWHFRYIFSFSRLNKVYIFIIFLLVSLYIKKSPFSIYSMYNKFKENVQVFYIEDENNNLIALDDISNTQSSVISKMFYSYLSENNLSIKQVDNDIKLRAEFGKYLIKESINPKLVRKKNIEKISLYKKTFFIKNDSLKFVKYKFYESSY